MSQIPNTQAQPQKKKLLNNELIASFIPGGIAGALSRTTSAPFERIKVLYQVQGPGNKQSYNEGILKSLIKIYKEEGFKGFFRGNGINCIRVFPYSAVQYATFQNYKNFILTRHQRQGKIGNSTELNVEEKLIGGGIAGLSSVAATYPMDLVKTRLSIQTASLYNLKKSKVDIKIEAPPGILKSMINIYQHEGGVRALYRGFIPTAMGVAPYTALSFTFYEKIKEALPPNLQQHAYTKLAIGGISGAISQTLIYPFDLLRRRFQVASMGQNEMGFKYNSVWHALTTIVQKEGTKGLYKGLWPNLFKIVPQMAIQWTSYEMIRDYMKN